MGLLRRTLNSSQVIVHLGIKTYLNHIISECLPSPELLQPTAPEAPSPNGKNQLYQHDGYSPLSQPPTPEHSKLLPNERTLTPPLSSLVLELPLDLTQMVLEVRKNLKPTQFFILN